MAISAGLLIAIFMILTRLQLSYWRSGITLFDHALRVTSNNYVIHNNLGIALSKQGKNQEAIAQYAEALRIKPDFAEAHFSLALAYLDIGNRGLALEEYKILKTINPDLGEALSQKIFR